MLSPLSVFFPPAQRFSLLFLLLALLSTVVVVQAQRSFPPWLGCDDTFSQGIPTTGRDDECYAVDSSLCRYAFRDGCRETLATYYYYMGGIDTDYPYQEYYRVSVRAANAACNRTCYVKVNGQECAQCSSQGQEGDYRAVTLNDCSNIPGVFPIGPQAINVVKDKQVEGNPQYFQLAYNETRCQHPALQQPFTTPPETQLPTNATDSNNTSSNNTAMNDGGNISMAPSLEATFLIPAEEEEEDDPLESNSTPTSSPTTTDMSTSLRGGSGGFGRVDSRDEAPTSKESIKTQKQSSTETIQIVVHPKFKLLSCSRLSSSSSAGTAISDNAEEDKKEPQPSLSNTESMLSLIEDTNTFLGLLLRQYIPHLMDASMTDLATGPASISASDEDACDMSSVTDSSSDMFLNFTLTLTMVVPDDDKTTTPAITTRQVAEYVADNHHLNDYVHTVVQKSFPQVHTVRAWVTS